MLDKSNGYLEEEIREMEGERRMGERCGYGDRYFVALVVMMLLTAVCWSMNVFGEMVEPLGVLRSGDAVLSYYDENREVARDCAWRTSTMRLKLHTDLKTERQVVYEYSLWGTEEWDLKVDESQGFWGDNYIINIYDWGYVVTLVEGNYASQFMMTERADKGSNWPSSWVCGSCGYSNFEGIERCGLCGTRSP